MRERKKTKKRRLSGHAPQISQLELLTNIDDNNSFAAPSARHSMTVHQPNIIHWFQVCLLFLNITAIYLLQSVSINQRRLFFAHAAGEEH